MRVRFTKSARWHRIGKARALHVTNNVAPVRPRDLPARAACVGVWQADGKPNAFATCRALDAVVLPARLRVDLLVALHKGPPQPLDVPAQMAAFSMIAR